MAYPKGRSELDVKMWIISGATPTPPFAELPC